MKRLAILLVLGTLFCVVLSQRPNAPIMPKAAREIRTVHPNAHDAYARYLGDVPHYPAQSIMLDYRHLDMDDSTDFHLEEAVEGAHHPTVIHSGDTGRITLVFDNPEAGFYNMRIRYFPVPGKSGAIERDILINGTVPYEMARQLSMKRIWVNATNTFLQDLNGNDIVPRQVEAPRWVEMEVEDPNGFLQRSLDFYFEEGINTLTFEAVREPVLFDYVLLYQRQEAPDYATYRAEHATRENHVSPDTIAVVQGQHMHEKTSPTLYPIFDRTSPLTTPQHHALLRLNAGGGINYRMVGDWISYEIDVPEDGFYNLSLIVKQTFLRGAYVTRNIKINGETPFKEMERVAFNYGNWRRVTLGGETPYDIYLTAGTHVISLEVVLGDFAPSIQEVEAVIDTLNSLYREIIMITSTTPDRFRDYLLPQRIPHLLPTLEAQLEQLEAVIEALVEVTKETGDQTAVLRQMAVQLEGFLDRPHTIHQRLGEYRNNVSALGAWVLNIKEQPLTIDAIELHAPEASLPRARANIFERLWFEFRSFIASFFVDYNSLSGTSEIGGDGITVWIGSGRDQANILRRMIDESFSPQTGISVKLQLVDPGVLLPATFTGRGPDVMMNVGNTTPVNFAMRNAAYDLSQFPDFDETMAAFKESALLPYRFEGGVYAMPEQQIFPVLFYREDILTEIGLIPENADQAFWDTFTWDDVIDMIPELQRLNLEFFLPIDIVEQQLGGIIPPNLIYVSLLYQNGGQLYESDGSRTLLQERVAMETFKTWSDFYTNYRFTVQANFVNRFRTGEMPIGISYYSMYNVLSVFAPEISGNWRFTTIPGTRQEDGTISHATPSTGTGAILLQQSQNPELAWEYLKWWGSEAVQVQFGREMEGIMGAAARYPTANVAALQKLPWPARDIQTLMLQWESVQGIPEVPGSYITGRYLDNALRRVINTGANPRETLYEYAELINDEIRNKRREFGLD